jgi:hypothetical protein
VSSPDDVVSSTAVATIIALSAWQPVQSDRSSEADVTSARRSSAHPKKPAATRQNRRQTGNQKSRRLKRETIGFSPTDIPDLLPPRFGSESGNLTLEDKLARVSITTAAAADNHFLSNAKHLTFSYSRPQRSFLLWCTGMKDSRELSGRPILRSVGHPIMRKPY